MPALLEIPKQYLRDVEIYLLKQDASYKKPKSLGHPSIILPGVFYVYDDKHVLYLIFKYNAKVVTKYQE
jgi:hypothetical protein